MQFADDFDGDDLDTAVWVPHYLPHWSSRAETAATYALSDSELRLSIPPEQGLWCAEDHDPPLRVSGIQSGLTTGQQPFREGLAVREQQPEHRGWTPEYGTIEVRARMDLSPRSMASVWMVGLEDSPERSGEICVFEVFGDAPDAVGMGIHPFRDPDLAEDFEAPALAIDVADHHVYAARWRPGQVDFVVDGRPVRTCTQAPAYPMQIMVAVFDFPAKDPGGAHAGHVPALAVDWVRSPASAAASTTTSAAS